MAMPQRDDTIEAIKRRVAEKKAAEEKKKAEARATGEEGMGESPAPVQAPRAVAVTGCGEGVNVV